MAARLQGVDLQVGPARRCLDFRRDFISDTLQLRAVRLVPYNLPTRRPLVIFISALTGHPLEKSSVAMADKEASVYIVDLGSTMANCNNGRAESDLDWSLRYVWDKIATTAQSKRKTWCVGVVGLRTDETDNKYMKDGYEQISVLQDLGPVTLPEMKRLKTRLAPSNSINGDALSAVIIANEMVVDFTKKNKWDRKVYLITDGQGAIDEDDVDDIASRVNDVGITLTVMSV